MAFIDEIKFKSVAGSGGDGVVRWRQEKFIDRGGPNGGNGGRGGNVIIEAVRDTELLSKYTHRKLFEAERGYDGEGQSKHGANGENLIIKLPIGSKITDTTNNKIYNLEKEGEIITILHGGSGGYGNEHFKSSTNQAPKQATSGKEGESGDFHVEMELIADIGLVGMPNAGKSSLINALTNTHTKVGNYAFTTLEPSLGDFFGYIIADIPGLIEGASKGKGLGVKFLRHIKRTKKLLHLVSFENENMLKTYEDIRNELKEYGNGLYEKSEIILLAKTDIIDEEKVKQIKKEFEEKYEKEVFTISLFDDLLIKEFSDILIKILRDNE